MSLSCLAEAMRSQAGSFNLDHGHQPGLCEWIIGTNGSMDQWIMDLLWKIGLMDLDYMAMGQYLYITFLGAWTSINPSYFDVHQGTRVLTHCHMIMSPQKLDALDIDPLVMQCHAVWTLLPDHGREQRARRALGKTPRSDFWQTMGQGHCFGVVQV